MKGWLESKASFSVSFEYKLPSGSKSCNFKLCFNYDSSSRILTRYCHCVSVFLNDVMFEGVIFEEWPILLRLFLSCSFSVMNEMQQFGHLGVFRTIVYITLAYDDSSTLDVGIPNLIYHAWTIASQTLHLSFLIHWQTFLGSLLKVHKLCPQSLFFRF